MPVVTPTCEDYANAIGTILRQAKMAYQQNLGELNAFTKKYLGADHSSAHDKWNNYKIESLNPTKKKPTPLILESYEKLDPNVLKHLQENPLEISVIHDELQDLYARLTILDHAFQFITHENNTVDEFDQKLYDSYHNYIKVLITETSDSMRKLNIQKPESEQPNLTNVDIPYVPLRDWVVIREHMKLLKYIEEAYNILLSRCPYGN